MISNPSVNKHFVGDYIFSRVEWTTLAYYHAPKSKVLVNISSFCFNGRLFLLFSVMQYLMLQMPNPCRKSNEQRNNYWTNSHSYNHILVDNGNKTLMWCGFWFDFWLNNFVITMVRLQQQNSIPPHKWLGNTLPFW